MWLSGDSAHTEARTRLTGLVGIDLDRPAAGMGLMAPLTAREIRALPTRGASNRAISQSLSLAGGTVQHHLSTIVGTLGVRHRTQAALEAEGSLACCREARVAR